VPWGLGGRGAFTLLLTFVINGITAETHEPCNTVCTSLVCYYCSKLRFYIPFGTAAARGNFIARPETPRNCITKAFAPQLTSQCILLLSGVYSSKVLAGKVCCWAESNVVVCARSDQTTAAKCGLHQMLLITVSLMEPLSILHDIG
jgi:hypothetical protein